MPKTSTGIWGCVCLAIICLWQQMPKTEKWKEWERKRMQLKMPQIYSEHLKECMPSLARLKRNDRG